MKKFCVTIILSALILIDVAAQAVLEKRITFSIQNTTVEEVLNLLEKSASCSFAYSSDLPVLKQKRSIEVVNKTLGETLELLLGEELEWKVSNEQIILFKKNESPKAKHTLSGFVKDKSSGELLFGASVLIVEQTIGVTSNAYGFYSISLAPATYTLSCSFVGFDPFVQTISLDRDVRLSIELIPSVEILNTVEVSAKAVEFQEKLTGQHTLSLPKLKSIPVLAGETDVIKSIQLLPGVKTLGEGSSGFFVRGGGVDQNLILLDEAPVYNPAHLLGFFSAFNADALKSVKLYSGAIPASFGGRLASLLDIRMKEGNSRKWEASGGIGLISSRIMVEGPLKKDKASMMFALRRSYADLLLPLIDNEELNDTKLSFYDLNAKVNWVVNNRNKLFMSAYTGDDTFHQKDLFSIGWGNRTSTLRWNHLFSEKLFSNVSLIYSKFNYQSDIQNDLNPSASSSNVEDYNIKADFVAFTPSNSVVSFGLNAIYHKFNPETEHQESISTSSHDFYPSLLLEHAAYLAHELTAGKRWWIEYGMRYSLSQNLGRAKVYQFNSSHQLIDSTLYQAGEIYNVHGGMEPRLNIKYTLKSSANLTFTYNRMRQYVQKLSNYAGSFASPELWLPSGPNIKPQVSDQVAAGYFNEMSLVNQKIEFSAEVYYKSLYNVIDYKDHAQLGMNPYMEGEIRTGTGQSYGLELLLRKNSGRMTGWISYTLSKTERKIPEVNEGKKYPAQYDKPHAISLVAAYKISDRWSFSSNWVFTSGERFTVPVASYQYSDKVVPIYSARNAYKMPAYHRLDLSVTLDPRIKSDKKFSGSWTFSLYNAYFRKNAFQINYNRQVDRFGNVVSGSIGGMNSSLFGIQRATTKTYLFGIVPSITYNFKLF